MLCASSMVSCNDFLDTNPDNRAIIDNEQKVENLLVGAYPDHDHICVAELVSDNMDDYGESNPETDRFCEDTWAWKEEKEQDDGSLESFWQTSLVSISAANEALKAIENMPESSAMQEAKGEALMCRAYNYFMLANMFCMPYDKAKNDTQLGLPYLTEPEVQLSLKYKRGNMTDLYNHIQADIEEGLPLVNGSYYTVPKYHFTKRAAYAFATRFYLFTEQWQKAIDAATLCLGDNPATMLRDWKYMSTLPQNKDAVTNQYINADENANLLLLTSYSNAGLIFGAYRLNSRFSHGGYLAETEDMSASQLWGNYSAFYMTPQVYSATNMDKTIFWKLPYIFEYTDPVAKIGYRHTVYPAFTSDETLLSRAEAYIMLKQYDKAMEDLNLWCNNFYTARINMTPESVTEFYNQMKYYKWDEPTAKKHLHPAFAIDAEGSTQESMLQLLLNCRRTENWGEGLRWFDIKRYGIEIYRRAVNGNGQLSAVTDSLKVDDPRRAIQVPVRCIDAGLQPNPRNNQ